jgi:luciferase-type oxidoreductase
LPSDPSAPSWRKQLRKLLIGPSPDDHLGRKPFVTPRQPLRLFGKPSDEAPPAPYVPPDSPGFRRMFARDQLTLGLFFAIDNYDGDLPDMSRQVELARRADELGFAALWTLDVPLRDPSFGDVGQIYDPWVWLGLITGATRNITLATGSIVFPLSHPITLAKAAASVDQLSGGRLFLGIASGDRAVEFPAFGLDIDKRGDVFRESLGYFNRLLYESFPEIDSPLGKLAKADLIPKARFNRIPVGITGHCRQDPPWIAANCDAWIMYSNSPNTQSIVMQTWRDAVAQSGADFKPFVQPLQVDLSDNPNEDLEPIRSGYRLGRSLLIELLERLRAVGVNHVALNFKRGQRPAAEVMEEIGQEVLPLFPSHDSRN